MKLKLGISVLLLLFCDLHSSTPKCNKESKCTCLEGYELEIQCPTESREKESIIIHITDTEILIDCPINLKHFKLSYLPNITIDKANILRLRFCPLLQESFRRISDWFSLKQVTSFEVSFSNMKNQAVSARNFEGFEELKDLKITDNLNIHLDTNTFANTPNLTTLHLQNNNVVLKPKLFQNVQQLLWLDLSGNNIRNLPEHIFDPLENLRILHLWNNKLTELDDFVFRKLTNLISVELSLNRIENISENAFRSLKSLKRVNLTKNRLRNLQRQLFTFNEQLKMVRVRHNFDQLQLSDYLFANLSLIQVELTNCSLEFIPEYIFENTTTLRYIKLKNNKIKFLPDSLFKGLSNLRKISLENNQIRIISNTFHDLHRLQSLHLQNNLIETLDKNIFRDLTNLEVVNLKGNKIKKIYNAFSNNKELRVINLSYNEITDSAIVLENSAKLSTLDLGHNHLSVVKLEDIKVTSKVSIRLDNNQITFIDFHNITSKEDWAGSYIFLSNNPIICDCPDDQLVDFLKRKPRNVRFKIRANELKCDNPHRDVSRAILNSTLTCPISTACPEKCSCQWRPYDKSLVFNCSHNDWTEFPNFTLNQIEYPFDHTEIYLEGNLLEDGPPDWPAYGNATKLFLSFNRIQKIEWLPSVIKVLRIDHNQISSLDSAILEILSESEQVSLESNPWICDCNSKVFIEFLRQRKSSVNNYNLLCANMNFQLIDLKESDLCPASIFFRTATVLAIAFLICFIFLTIYYRHKRRINVWLLSKNLCAYFSPKENLDSSKTYDIFVSYSNKDEDFVVENLLPTFENCSQPYKLCLYHRNWIPGEFIGTQITNSVTQSRRILIVLSQNYTKSERAQMEFRIAHSQAVSDNCARIIIVLYGEVDDDDLDENLKIYLKSNTYLKWGDPYFWEKLRKVLPKYKERAYEKMESLGQNV